MDRLRLHPRSLDVLQDGFGRAGIDGLERGMRVDEQFIRVARRLDVSSFHSLKVGEHLAAIPLCVEEVLDDAIVGRRSRSVVGHRLHLVKHLLCKPLFAGTTQSIDQRSISDTRGPNISRLHVAKVKKAVVDAARFPKLANHSVVEKYTRLNTFG